MDTKIKEETEDTSLCFESSGEDLASLTLVEKYDRYLRSVKEDVESEDEDFLPDEYELREEYDRLRADTANYASSNKRLTTGLSRRYINTDPELSVVDDDTTEDSNDGEKDDAVCLNELLEVVDSVRRFGPDSNSIFCTQAELEQIRESYKNIIDFILKRSTNFSKTSRDSGEQQSDEEEEDRAGDQVRNNVFEPNNNEEKKLLGEKMEMVQQARDRFYEVEQVVREQLDQLELVERYKMESVG